MPTKNEQLVSRAFEACKAGDTAALQEVFGYNEAIHIEGAARCEEPYPTLDGTKINYENPVDQRDGTVRTRFRFRRETPSGDEEYWATTVDRIENGKIQSSTVRWDGWNYQGDTDNDWETYKNTYGWWGWPFGRRRT